MGISLQLGKYSSFIIHTCPERQVLGNSSLLFWREKVLSEMGLRIVRFGNEEIVKDAARSAVVGKIMELVLE